MLLSLQRRAALEPRVIIKVAENNYSRLTIWQSTTTEWQGISDYICPPAGAFDRSETSCTEVVSVADVSAAIASLASASVAAASAKIGGAHSADCGSNVSSVI
jgi:hypothetical protein